MNSIRSDIVLIGPIGTGKTTVGVLLAERLQMPHIELDSLRWDYYREIGYDRDYGRRLREAEGFAALSSYWKPFEAHAVERFLSDYSGYILDFGAGHSVYEDEELFVRVQRALAPFNNVVLLLPSPDPGESVNLLKARLSGQPDDVLEANEHFVRHPSNQRLAKLVVYTKGKTPEQACDEVLGIITP